MDTDKHHLSLTSFPLTVRIPQEGRKVNEYLDIIMSKFLE